MSNPTTVIPPKATSNQPTPAQVVPMVKGTPPKERIAQEPALPLITEAHVAFAEKSVSNIQRIRSLALRVTSENDWTDVAGKPYLNHSGAMKVAALFGVSLTGMRVEESREKVGEKEVVRFVACTTAKFLGREVE